MNSPETFDGSITGGAKSHEDPVGALRGVEYAERINTLAIKRDQLTKRIDKAIGYLDQAQQKPSSETLQNLLIILTETRVELAETEQLINDLFLQDAISSKNKIEENQQKLQESE